VATQWKITADSTPVLDGWGWADYWPINVWQQWHMMLKAKYGLDEANKRFLFYWRQQTLFSNPLDARTFNANFRNYAKENGFFNDLYSTTGGIFAKPINWPGQIFAAGDTVITGATGGIVTGGKILKYGIPAGLVLIFAALAFYLYNLTARR
jgi:hypothetical protein